MCKKYQKLKLKIIIFEENDVVTLSTGNPGEKFFDMDWAGVNLFEEVLS